MKFRVGLKDKHGFTSRKVKDDGTLVAPAVLARTGIQVYKAFELSKGLDAETARSLGLSDPMKNISLYRPPEEVFAEESVSSMHFLPVTDNHPPVFVNESNASEFKKGSIGKVEKKGETELSTEELSVTDPELVAKIMDGKVEISIGYDSDILFESGVTPEGIPYDAKQVNIRGNHVAIVNAGRCGARCKISDKKVGNPMEIIINGIRYQVEDASLATAIQTVLKEKSELSTKLDTAAAEKQAFADSMETLKSTHAQEIENVKKDVPDVEMIDQLVENRIAVRDGAEKLVPGFDTKGKDCEQVRKEVVIKLNDKAPQDASADYYRAAFDIALSMKDSVAPTPDAGAAQLAGAVAGAARISDSANSGTPELNPVQQARQRMMDKAANLWKGPQAS